MRMFAPRHLADPTANARKYLDRRSARAYQVTSELHLRVDPNVSLAQNVPRS